MTDKVYDSVCVTYLTITRPLLNVGLQDQSIIDQGRFLQWQTVLITTHSNQSTTKCIHCYSCWCFTCVSYLRGRKRGLHWRNAASVAASVLQNGWWSCDTFRMILEMLFDVSYVVLIIIMLYMCIIPHHKTTRLAWRKHQPQSNRLIGCLQIPHAPREVSLSFDI